MAHINSTAVSGNLTADPEVKELPSGTMVASLRMAHNRSRKVNEEYVEEVSYFDVEVFGNFANLIGRKLRKADAVAVTGRLEQQRWETEAGNRSKVVIIAQQIDSPAFFKKDEEVAPLEVGAKAGGEMAATAAGDDDIPF